MALTFAPEPDLRPLYPSRTHLELLLAVDSGLTPSQRHDLVQHSLIRACTFADLALLTYLLADTSPRFHIDLAATDEDGLGLISTTILGFGGESERDLEREECVRLLVAEGADVNAPDNAGWTPLHHAALLSPPTLVSYLLTHGCSPLSLTRRRLTPLDILTAHSLIPGRDAVAFLLEEAMREHGWDGGAMERRRRRELERAHRHGTRKSLKHEVGTILGLPHNWWGGDCEDDCEDSDSEDEDDDADDTDGPMNMSYSPTPNFTTMLVFSPATLDSILDSLTYNVRPALRCSEPARALYLLARFACLACNDTWLEDLMGAAVDRIERIVFAKADDIVIQAFWLYNTTTLLHFLRCDSHIAEYCDVLDLFSLLEGVIRAVYVFIVRTAERKIDPLLDAALLDHIPLSSEFDSLHFEGEWSLFRSLAGSGAKLAKKKHESTPPPGHPVSPTSLHGISFNHRTSTSRPPSPSPSLQNFQTGTSQNSRLSWAQSLTRTRASSLAPSPTLISQYDPHGFPKPQEITKLLEAFHSLLTLAGINPALITQIYSQVMYWTACEMFNRILTRKKYLCRSRAIQIGMNLSVLEEWVVRSGLPQGVESHFTAVRELLHWLQCSSSIVEFTTLVETIQTMKNLNPLQMRRAVRDYRYEVSESRMSEECTQYLIQLHKDWERRRVRLGVEALRRETGEREHAREGSISSVVYDASESASHAPSMSTVSTEISDAQRGIDLLFSRDHERADWCAPQPPEALGELRDSRYMLPLVLPSNPRLLAAVLCRGATTSAGRTPKRNSQMQTPNGNTGAGTFALAPEERSVSRASAIGRGAMAWRSRGRKLRMIGIETLEWVDGVRGLGRWSGGADLSLFGDEEEETDTDESVGRQATTDRRNEEAGQLGKAGTTLTQKPRRSLSSRRGHEVESSFETDPTMSITAE